MPSRPDVAVDARLHFSFASIVLLTSLLVVQVLEMAMKAVDEANPGLPPRSVQHPKLWNFKAQLMTALIDKLKLAVLFEIYS